MKKLFQTRVALFVIAGALAWFALKSILGSARDGVVAVRDYIEAERQAQELQIHHRIIDREYEERQAERAGMSLADRERAAAHERGRQKAIDQAEGRAQ